MRWETYNGRIPSGEAVVICLLLSNKPLMGDISLADGPIQTYQAIKRKTAWEILITGL